MLAKKAIILAALGPSVVAAGTVGHGLTQTDEVKDIKTQNDAENVKSNDNNQQSQQTVFKKTVQEVKNNYSKPKTVAFTSSNALKSDQSLPIEVEAASSNKISVDASSVESSKTNQQKKITEQVKQEAVTDYVQMVRPDNKSVLVHPSYVENKLNQGYDIQAATVNTETAEKSQQAKDETTKVITENNANKHQEAKNSVKDKINEPNLNDDKVRRDLIEKEYGIKLTEDDVWHMNTDEGYTTKEQLIELNSYATNASRQELIQYAIRTNDWQPYRAFEAKRTPAYFEIVNGKYEYNKLYYGNLIEGDLRLIAQVRMNGAEKVPNVANDVTVEDLEKHLNERIDEFNKAPGIVPYVVGLNSNEELAKQYGVKMPSDDFYDSKWNGIMGTGVFKENINVDKAEGTVANDKNSELKVKESKATPSHTSEISLENK